MGFIICGLIVVVYVVLINKAINIAKTAREDLGSYIAIGIARNFSISRSRKYRYVYWIASNYGNTITICKLWRNFICY